MRKLATIREIRDIKPIPGADRIEVAKVDGWEVVISKKDNFKIGDKVVYIEIDSKVPATPLYSFLESRKYIVKTIVMRGQVSQGLIMPLSILPEGEYKVGDDLTETLGIAKYDPQLEQEKLVIEQNKKNSKNPIVKYFLRYKWFRKIYLKPTQKTDFPNWIKKTDEERIQNMPKLFQRLKDENITLTVTEKIDGCSGTFYLKKIGRKKYEFGVCSRNRRLVTPDNSYYWRAANKFKIREALEGMIGSSEWIVLQGEITGKGIQGNKYDDDLSFWAFNLITPDERFDTLEMGAIIKPHGLYTVPIYKLGYTVEKDSEISDIVEFAKGKSQVVNKEREGFVFRNIENNISFKAINPNFLIKNNE